LARYRRYRSNASRVSRGVVGISISDTGGSNGDFVGQVQVDAVAGPGPAERQTRVVSMGDE